MNISVIIRNRNEGEHLRNLLRALGKQSQPAQVIVVDNESTDGSADIAKSSGAEVVHLPKDSFTYGGALNAGIRRADGNICVVLSAHSLPVGHTFLERCLHPFGLSSEIAAARCVLCGKSADTYRWLNPEILRAPIDLQEIRSKGPLASGCVLRRAVWEEIPFDETHQAAEDKLWALAVVNAGYSIYSPIDAPYLYLRRKSRLQQVRINHRERVAILRATGVGRVRYSEAAKALARTWFANAPAAFATEFLSGTLGAYLMARRSHDARRSPTDTQSPDATDESSAAPS